MKIYLSLKPKAIGGGSNTFSGLFKKWAEKKGYKIVRSIARAELAIVIAHLADEADLIKAKNNGCRIIHRLDEYFEVNEDEARREKHAKIISLNKYADLTVFQSSYVLNNVFPYIKPRSYQVIHNGGDPEKFSPARDQGKFIGHVTWGIDTKKRLDLLYEFIRKHPDEEFLLVGRHRESKYDFALPNVKVVGKVRQSRLPEYFRMMKFLYFPSEKDPCPNTVIESILCGVPVCYNKEGGTVELVTGPAAPNNNIHEDKGHTEAEFPICGLPLESAGDLLKDPGRFRNNCFLRDDLSFARVFEKYIEAAKGM